MADHVVKMSEVPKGQKFQFFIDYYGLKTLVALFIAGFLIYAVIAACQPKPDARILLATDKETKMSVLTEIETKFNTENTDFNGDGKNMMVVNYNYIDLQQRVSNPEGYVTLNTKLMTSVGDTTQIFHILDDDMFAFFLEHDAIGTYGDMEGYETGHEKTELIKIPLSECGLFDENVLGSKAKELYLTIRPRENSYLHKEKNLENYNNHVKLLAEIMGFEPTK